MTDKINDVPIRCRYRVMRDRDWNTDGEIARLEIVRLYVTVDGKIWLGFGEYPESVSHIANVGENGTKGTSRDAICRAANYW